MSLRTVHIVFLLASLAMVSGFGAWCFNGYQEHQTAQYLAGLGAAVLGVSALLFYSVYFLRKVGLRR